MNPPIDIDGAWEHNKTKKEQYTKNTNRYIRARKQNRS